MTSQEQWSEETTRRNTWKPVGDPMNTFTFRHVLIGYKLVDEHNAEPMTLSP